MEFRCVSTSANLLESWEGDTLAVGLFSDPEHPGRARLTELFGATLAEHLELRRFKAKPGEALCIERLGQHPSTLAIVGLGEASAFHLTALRHAVASASRIAAKVGCGHLGLLMPVEGFGAAAAAAAMAEAVRLSLYADRRFKSESEPPILPEQVSLLELPPEASEGLEHVEAICGGVELARQLVAAPPNVATPQALADVAEELARDYGMDLRVLERADCDALGMGAYLGVARGSDLPPKFIHLTYRPDGEIQRRVVLIGKGLTFDSGGYNLKTAGSQIEMMKYDMGGSAAVLGAARALGQRRPEGVEVHVIVASCENMISGNAIHPGDILTASNGTTIEINNTDAEGRLTLADALVYASRLEPDAIVDLATLTGACVIALGEEIAGLWTTSDLLADGLLSGAVAGGEALWRMPLRDSYREGLKSTLADLKNTGPRPGGSITAALFLRDFVGENIPWAHIDIAGTVWSDKARGQDPAGATGFGVHTLVNWICDGAPA